MATFLSRARTRRRFTLEEKTAHVAHFERSGLSHTDFCRQAHIHPSTFSQWRRKPRPPVEGTISGFAQVQLIGPKPDHTSVVTLRLANGAALEVSAQTATTWQGLGLLLKTLQS